MQIVLHIIIGLTGLRCMVRDSIINEFVLAGFQEDDLPSFGKITAIIIAAGSTPLLALTMYKTQYFHSHLSAYISREQN